MNRLISRLRLIFLIVFLVGATASFAYSYFWLWPQERCERAQSWWDPQTRVCARPILISDITGRPIGQERTPEEIAAARARTTQALRERDAKLAAEVAARTAAVAPTAQVPAKASANKE